jgi:hypothetical protein
MRLRASEGDRVLCSRGSPKHLPRVEQRSAAPSVRVEIKSEVSTSRTSRSASILPRPIRHSRSRSAWTTRSSAILRGAWRSPTVSSIPTNHSRHAGRSTSASTAGSPISTSMSVQRRTARPLPQSSLSSASPVVGSHSRRSPRDQLTSNIQLPNPKGHLVSLAVFSRVNRRRRKGPAPCYVACCQRIRNTPPAQTHGNAVTTRRMGYQRGPN